jgi:L-malate glycosyltransferase
MTQESAEPRKTKNLNILISVTDLCIGGGQSFATRLAKYLAQANFVLIFNYETFEKKCESLSVEQLPENLKIVSLSALIYWLAKAIDAVILKINIRPFVWQTVQEIHLKLLIAFHKIDIVNSHLYNSDDFVVNTLKKSKIPIVISDHGDYLYVTAQNLSTPEKVQSIVARANAIVYPSSFNAQAISKYTLNSNTLEEIIYYGIPTLNPKNYAESARKKLKISEDTFVFGMVARGIPNKGWSEAIEAFKLARKLSEKDIHLILVGGGEYLSSLESRLDLQLKACIHFTGYSSDPNYWVESFDVGLLPTYFPGESLPNSVIEYLLLGKPVIATEVGGISEMISYQERKAGYVIGLSQNGKVNVSDMSKAMVKYINDSELLKEHSSLTKYASEKFKMETCIDAYEKIFQKVLN